MGAKKAAASGGAKKLTPAQEKKAARKAEIAAAKAQSDIVKGAANFNPLEKLSQFAKFSDEKGLDLTIDFLTGEAATSEIRTTVSGLMAEGELPTGGKGVLLEENVSFLLAKNGESIVGFAAYHFGFHDEVNALCVDWICVGEEARKKGLATFLLEALSETATETQMKGVIANLPSSATSAHPGRLLLAKAGFEVDALQNKSGVTLLSKILDAEAKELLETKAAALKKAASAKDRMSSSAFADQCMGAGSFG